MSITCENDHGWPWRSPEPSATFARGGSEADHSSEDPPGDVAALDREPIDDDVPSRPQFSLALLFELKLLLGVLLAVPLIGRALFTAAVIVLLFMLAQLPFFWLFGAFRIPADERL